MSFIVLVQLLEQRAKQSGREAFFQAGKIQPDQDAGQLRLLLQKLAHRPVRRQRIGAGQGNDVAGGELWITFGSQRFSADLHLFS